VISVVFKKTQKTRLQSFAAASIRRL